MIVNITFSHPPSPISLPVGAIEGLDNHESLVAVSAFRVDFHHEQLCAQYCLVHGQVVEQQVSIRQQLDSAQYHHEDL